MNFTINDPNTLEREPLTCMKYSEPPSSTGNGLFASEARVHHNQGIGQNMCACDCLSHYSTVKYLSKQPSPGQFKSRGNSA